MSLPDSHIYPVLFFDGVCNMCNSTVQFILKRDKKEIFRFASLQSPPGEEALSQLAQDMNIAPDSVLLWYRNRFYTKSDAVLQTVKLLGGPWSMLTIGYILPRFVRNKIYDIVAANRYRWFGKRDACMIPGPGVRSRFLG